MQIDVDALMRGYEQQIARQAREIARLTAEVEALRADLEGSEGLEPEAQRPFPTQASS